VTARYSDDEMLAELRRVAAGEPLSRPLYTAARPAISAPAITARFGSWLAALEKAGVSSPYAYGGTWASCPICGDRFRVRGGVKAAKTCGRRSCTSELMSREHSHGDAASPQAARGRAGRVTKERGRCERCGLPPGPRAHDRHHRDRDPYNNDPANIEVLCRDCHAAEHDAAGDGWSAKKKRDESGRFLPVR
jgi:hypothetical protein